MGRESFHHRDDRNVDEEDRGERSLAERRKRISSFTTKMFLAEDEDDRGERAEREGRRPSREWRRLAERERDR